MLYVVLGESESLIPDVVEAILRVEIVQGKVGDLRLLARGGFVTKRFVCLSLALIVVFLKLGLLDATVPNPLFKLPGYALNVSWG